MSELAVALYGTPTQAQLDKAGAAFVGLVDALTEEMGYADRLKWQASGWLRGCDTCGHRVPFTETLPPGWTSDGYYDSCEACTTEAAR